MARGVNKVILIGNLGSDPEARYMTNGNAVVSLSVATSSSWKDKNTGETQERTEWHRVVFFNRLAEIVNQYLRKGAKVYLEGSLRTRKWTDKDNVEKYTTEIIVDEMQMLDSRGAASADASSEAPYRESTSHAAPAAKSAPATQQHASTTDFDDDIPF